MRRDHRPLWLHQMQRALERFRAKRFLEPQCDAVGEGCRFENPGYIHLSGSGLRLGRQVHLSALASAPIHLSTWKLDEQEPGIEVGDYSVINPGVRIISGCGIRIGEGALIATGAYITDADWHGKYHRVFPPGSTSEVVLENNVWVADSAMILKGVHIGQNSIVGAGAVVTRDVPANCIVAGNPARRVGELDPRHAATDRRQLFEELDYVGFEVRHQRTVLGRNTLYDWVRSQLAPNRSRRD